VPTDTTQGRTDTLKFAARGIGWILGLFGLLRLNWTEVHAVLPFTRVQAAAAEGLFGLPASPVQVTLACSGTDALALCLGAVLAYPVPWRTRLAGAAGGAALILGLNTLRIGTLGQAAASPAWFDALHVYAWPALLTLAIAGYVFGWMRLADRGPSPDARPLAASVDRAGEALSVDRPKPTRRFIVLTIAFLLLFAAATPLYAESSGVIALAGFIARAAAAILGLGGVAAHAVANALWTPRGGFLVTEECISTPLIPVYLAAVCAHSSTWRRMTVGILAAAPLFIALAIARLLVVALPEVVASPIFFVHAFYQLLLGVVIVCLAAVWRHGGRAAPVHALAGVAAGVVAACLLGPLSTIRRGPSRSCRRFRSACISRCGSRPSSP
jgi:exosortase/archaeosortase family protein